jgi:hypothetical protein
LNLKADRRLLAAGGATILCVVIFFLGSASLSLEKERSSLSVKRKEILALRDDYLSLRAALNAAEARKTGGGKPAGIVQTIDELFGSMGLSQKVKSVKSTEARDRKYAVEEEAEVELEKVNMNEMTNIFYRIENGPFLLSVRKSDIKTNFENPALLNITMTVDLIKPK